MKVLLRILFAFLICLSCIACGKSNDLYLALNAEDYELTRGEYDKHYDGINSKIRVVLYFDSTMCSTCLLKNSFMWSNLINYVEKDSLLSSVVLILSPKPSEYRKVKVLLDEYMIDYPVYLDSTSALLKNNSFVTESFFCLLDSTSKIIWKSTPIITNKNWKAFSKEYDNISLQYK